MHNSLLKKAGATGLLLVAGTAVQAQHFIEAELFTIGESFSYSGAVPVTTYLDLMVGPPPKSGTHALTRNLFEFGMKLDAFSLSFIHRNDYNLDFARESAEFAWIGKLQNRRNYNLQIPSDRNYAVDIKANQYQLTGLKFGYDWTIKPNVKLYTAASYLVATEGIAGYMGKDPQGDGGVVRLYEEEVNGVMEPRVAGDIHANYFYTDDVLFRRDVDAGNGYGYSIDVGFDWKIDENWSVRGKIDDLKSQIRWDDMPHTIADATGDTIQFDEDGVLRAYPTFAGIETYDDFKQTLRRRDRLTVHYALPKYFFAYELDHMEVIAFHRLVAGYHFNERWRGKVALDTTAGALLFGLDTPLGQVQLMLDDLDVNNAHTLGFGWALHFPL